MNSDINGVRKRGRPRRRQQDLEEDLRSLNVKKWKEWHRDDWRHIVNEAKNHIGLQRSRGKVSNIFEIVYWLICYHYLNAPLGIAHNINWNILNTRQATSKTHLLFKNKYNEKGIKPPYHIKIIL